MSEKKPSKKRTFSLHRKIALELHKEEKEKSPSERSHKYDINIHEALLKKRGPEKLAAVLVKAKEYAAGAWQQTEVTPTIVGLSIYCLTDKDNIYKFAETNQELNDILKWVKQLQEYTLVNKGLNNETNSVITKLMLVNHGYRDKIEQSITNVDDGSIKEDKAQLILDAIRSKYADNT